jgi:hypothetical protein
LYDIEDRAISLTAAERCALRCAEANPILDKLEAYLGELASSVLPKSSLAKAVTYARNQWDALRCYTKDGRLTIDNNTAERTLRHQAVGRNYAEFGIMRSSSDSDGWFSVNCSLYAGFVSAWVSIKRQLSNSSFVERESSHAGTTFSTGTCARAD